MISQAGANVFDDPDKLAEFAAAESTGEVFESLVVDDRLRKALLFLKKKNSSKLNSKVNYPET